MPLQYNISMSALDSWRVSSRDFSFRAHSKQQFTLFTTTLFRKKWERLFAFKCQPLSHSVSHSYNNILYIHSLTHPLEHQHVFSPSLSLTYSVFTHIFFHSSTTNSLTYSITLVFTHNISSTCIILSFTHSHRPTTRNSPVSPVDRRYFHFLGTA